MVKIQLVDDESNILKALQRMLHGSEWDIHTFTDTNAALEALVSHEYAVIVSDYKMPDLDGITYLQFARQRQPQALRIMFSAHGDRESMIKAINQAEVFRFVSKPWDDDDVIATIGAAVEVYRLRAENAALVAQVKVQRNALQLQQRELERLEHAHPGVTKVDRDSDGSVVLDDLDSVDGQNL